MPFIRGRYHINAIAGEALEAAREAEAALRALEQAAHDHEAGQNSSQGGNAGGEDGGAQSGTGNSADNGAGDDEFGGDDAASNAAAQSGSARGPIRRVEIEAAEMVPAHSGRAERGIVARVHRDASAANSAAHASGGVRRAGAGPETHVFSSHGDMLNFLRDEFARDARRGSARAGR